MHAGARGAASLSCATSNTSCVDGKVQIVDEFTGRIADGRQWQNGLHQLIEVKEGVRGHRRATTRRQHHLSALLPPLSASWPACRHAGETAGELRAVYGLKVVRIRPTGPIQRKHAARRGSTATATRNGARSLE